MVSRLPCVAVWMSLFVATCWAAADTKNSGGGAVFVDEEVKTLTISPDGRLLATGHVNGSIEVRTLPSLALDPIFVLRDKGPSEITHEQFSREGRWLLSDGTNGDVKLWDLVTRKCVFSLGEGPDAPRQGRLSSDASFVAAVTREPQSKGDRYFCSLYSARDGSVRSRLIQPAGRDYILSALACSPDGTLLAASGADRAWKRRMVLIWSVREGKFLREVDAGTVSQVSVPAHERIGLEFSPNGEMLALASIDAGVLIWTVSNWQVRASLSQAGPAMQFAPNGRIMATSSRARTEELSEVMLWDLKSGRVTEKLSTFVVSVRSLAFSPDGLSLAVGGSATGTAVSRRPGKPNIVTSPECGGTIELLALPSYSDPPSPQGKQPHSCRCDEDQAGAQSSHDRRCPRSKAGYAVPR